MIQDVTPEGQLIYKVEYPTLAKFMQSTAAVQVIQGPVGSGKSKVCNLKAWAVAATQKPGAGGLRCTRGAIIRNTYPELVSTTMRTWKDTFPEEQYGRIVMSKPAFQHIRVGDISMEVDFLAMDKEDDVKKLRSSEYTWAYINELQYLPKVIFDEIQSRIEMGRFPAMKDGGPSWHGLWADMNSPDDDHFIAMMTGQTEWSENMPQDERDALRWPAEWDFFMQPPGLLEVMGPDGKPSGQYRANPAAENTKWLAPDAYLKMIRGKTRAWIKAHVLNQVALVIDGDPVWPWFRREVYVAGSVLDPVKGHPLWISLDFGRKPAALFGQFINNRVVILDEMQAFNEGATTFAPKVKRRLEQRYAGFDFKVTGDPKGQDKNQSDDRTAYDVWRSHDMPVTPSPVKMNMIQTRVEAVEHLGSSMYDGRPRLLVSPACRTLIVGMEGRYCYEKKQGSDQTRAEPKDSNYTHLCDCLQYMVISMGEGRKMAGLKPLAELRGVAVYKGHRSRRRVSA